MLRRELLSAFVFAALMTCAVVVAAAWKPHNYIADTKPKIDLERMVPREFGGWTVDPTIVPLQPAPDLQKVIDATYDQTLARTYRNAAGQRVMLSIAYGRNQHEGMNTHRPEICYPAQGLSIISGTRTEQIQFEGAAIRVHRLVAKQGSRIEPITYWLRVGDELTSFGRHHKLVALKYGLRGDIPDGLLMRVSSIDPNEAAAFQIQQQFIAQMLSSMSPDNRRLALGSYSPT